MAINSFRPSINLITPLLRFSTIKRHAIYIYTREGRKNPESNSIFNEKKTRPVIPIHVRVHVCATVSVCL